jgi:hypothetical protein
MKKERKHVAVVLVHAEPGWLALARDQRRRHWDAAVTSLAKHDGVDVQWCDGDGLSGRYSDFMLCSFDSLQEYQFLWEAIRDLPLFTVPYFRIVDVALGTRDGFHDYEASLR